MQEIPASMNKRLVIAAAISWIGAAFGAMRAGARCNAGKCSCTSGIASVVRRKLLLQFRHPGHPWRDRNFIHPRC
jgi:hypothetical protein